MKHERLQRADVDELVRRLQAGVDPEESFRRLFRCYYRMIHRFFAERGVSASECEDLVQETFLGVYRSIGGFRWETGFDGWLFAIARKTLARALRKAGTRGRSGVEVPIDEATTDLDAPAPSDGSGFRQVREGELNRAVVMALAELPDQMRRCATLRFRHGLKYREIAEALQISVNAVRVQLTRARKRLRRRLDEGLSPTESA